MAVLTVTRENLFYQPSSDWLWLPAQRRAQGLLLGSLPRVPPTVGYGPKIPNMIDFPQWHMVGVHTPRIKRRPYL
jgi:hypothetical protein